MDAIIVPLKTHDAKSYFQSYRLQEFRALLQNIDFQNDKNAKII